MPYRLVQLRRWGAFLDKVVGYLRVSVTSMGDLATGNLLYLSYFRSTV